MFDVGIGEALLLVVLALIIFGPDQLPKVASQAGRALRQLRAMANSARDDLRDGLGPEFADFELSDLDPRQAVRKHILEAFEDDDEPAPQRRGQRPLEAGERPPYDSDAT